MKGIGIRIALVAIVAIGAFVLRDRLSGNVGDLAVGDCFQATAATTVEDIQHTPCNEGHTAEVFYVGDYPAADNAPLPPIGDFATFVDNTCSDALLTYVGGIDVVSTDPVYQTLELNYFHPIAEGWGRGDREVICWIGSPAPMSKSLKAATQ